MSTFARLRGAYPRRTMHESTITGFVTGDYLAPAGHRLAGQRIVSVAYLVRHPEATVLFDTGFAFDEPTTLNEGDDEAELRTFPRSLLDLLGHQGASPDQLDLVANCHLHIDHAGGNFRLPPELPIYVQAAELEVARADPEAIVQDALALGQQAYRSVSGERELVPGVRLIPTPGHTPGHQSMLVQTADGAVVLAGQSVWGATEWSTLFYGWSLQESGDPDAPEVPSWLPRIAELEPVRACFAHDLAVWEAART